MAELAAAKSGRSAPSYLDAPFEWDPDKHVGLDYIADAELVGLPQRAVIESTPPGQVLVMDCRDVSRAASAGDIGDQRIAQWWSRRDSLRRVVP